MCRGNFLCNMRSSLNTEFGMVMNGEDIPVHMLWANDLILMSSPEIGLQKQLDGLLKFGSKYQLIVNTKNQDIDIWSKAYQ